MESEDGRPLSNKERRQLLAMESRKREVIQRRLYEAKKNDLKYDQFA